MKTYNCLTMEHDSESDSFFTHLPTGCRLCRLGAKMVLFVTGLCDRTCFYCPVSEEKSNKDFTFANERPVSSDKDILDEARSMEALGTGITGGEPMLVPDRVLGYIRLLKSAFGALHHIHLYTAQSPGRDTLERLRAAGLDEIRFHPPPHTWQKLEESGFVSSIEFSKELGFETGFEIPSLPGSEHVADTASKCGVFLNLNELEFSYTNTAALKEYGFIPLSDEGCAAAGSRDSARNVFLQQPELKGHFCSSCFKDAVQLRERLLRTARTAGRGFDEITPDGTLFYGVVEGDVDEIAGLLDELGVPAGLYELGEQRVEMGCWVLEEIAAHIGERFASWYEECYPTYGRMVVERIPIDI